MRHHRKELWFVQFLAGFLSSFVGVIDRVGVIDQILASDPPMSFENALKHIQHLLSVTPTGSTSNEASDASASAVSSVVMALVIRQGELDVGIVNLL